MFHAVRLTEALKYLTTPDEWSWFGPMVARGASHYDVDGWPLFTHRELRAYDEMWKCLVDRTHKMLRAGDWVAAGISHTTGPTAVSIDANLWDYLHIGHRGEEAEGSGFRFLALTVSEVKPSKALVSQRETGQLRLQLTSWIRQNVGNDHIPQLRADQLKAAREAFTGRDITENMFRDCRRAARLPASAVQNGRPKAKGLDKS